MAQNHEMNLALFLDFDNIALGLRDARQRFDIHLLLQRLLEKGKIVVKRAYADWQHHREYMDPLHEAGIELIAIPARRMTGKNNADIRLVVDAMDLCYSKEHIDSFVIVSGDSDFSPLVSKLRENAKQVIGVGVKNSTSKLLVNNCDEFIFYDDLIQAPVSRLHDQIGDVPADKRKLFDFLVVTTQRLLQESKGVLYGSLIKDTMKRKRPDFNESKHGYSTFGELLEDAKSYGLLDVNRDERAGGTWVVRSLGKGIVPPAEAATDENGRKRRRRPRRRGDREGEPREAESRELDEGLAARDGRQEPEPERRVADRREQGQGRGEPERQERRPEGRAPAPAAGRPEAAEEAGEPAEAAVAEGGGAREGTGEKPRRRRGRRSRGGRRDREQPSAGAGTAPQAAGEIPAAAPAEAAPGAPTPEAPGGGRDSEAETGPQARKKTSRRPRKAAAKAPVTEAAGEAGGEAGGAAGKKTRKAPATEGAKKTTRRPARKTARKAGGGQAEE